MTELYRNKNLKSDGFQIQLSICREIIKIASPWVNSPITQENEEKAKLMIASANPKE